MKLIALALLLATSAIATPASAQIDLPDEDPISADTEIDPNTMTEEELAAYGCVTDEDSGGLVNITCKEVYEDSYGRNCTLTLHSTYERRWLRLVLVSEYTVESCM